MKPQLICLISALALSIPTAYAEQPHAGSFWERKAEGWFFYAEPEPKPDPEVKPEPIVPPPTTQTVTKTPPPQSDQPASGISAPSPMSAAWFRENLPRYRDAAWDNPTKENVQTYMYLQRIAMDRSQTFADVSQEAVMGNPFLDETVRRPSATYAAQDLDKLAGAERQRQLALLSDKAGLFYFFASDCDICATQVQVMKAMENTFDVVPVSLDGQDLPGNPYPNFRQDSGHAQRLGITHLPATFLVSADGRFAPIGQGALGIDDMEKRLLIAGKNLGLVTEEDYHRTRPVRNVSDDLSTIVDIPERASSTSASSDDDSTGFIPPSDLLRNIEDSIKGARP